MARSNPGQARAARRDAGLCLRCGRPAAAQMSYVPAVIRRLAEGGGGDDEYTRILGRPWAHGDPIPTYARLAHNPWCVECATAIYEARELARQRRNRAETRARDRKFRRNQSGRERYDRFAEAGRCPRCGGERDREGVTCAACGRSAGRHPASASRERYERLAANGQCPRCGGMRDREGVTCSSCCLAARRRYLAARGGAADVAVSRPPARVGLEDDQ